MTQEFQVKISTLPSSLNVKTVAQSTNPNSLFQTIKIDLTTTDSNQLVGQFSSSIFRSAKYIIQFSYGLEFHTFEILMTHNGTDIFVTEYGEIYTSIRLGTLSATIESGYVKLYVTPLVENLNLVMKGILVPV